VQDDVVVVVELVAEIAPPSAFSGATVAEDRDKRVMKGCRLT
jgi:hypothetical protein